MSWLVKSLSVSTTRCPCEKLQLRIEYMCFDAKTLEQKRKKKNWCVCFTGLCYRQLGAEHAQACSTTKGDAHKIGAFLCEGWTSAVIQARFVAQGISRGNACALCPHPCQCPALPGSVHLLALPCSIMPYSGLPCPARTLAQRTLPFPTLPCSALP